MNKQEGRNSNLERFMNFIGLISIVAIVSIISFAVYKEFFYTPPPPTPIDMTKINEELREIPDKNKWERTGFVITNFDRAVKNHLKNVEFVESRILDGNYTRDLLKGKSAIIKLGNDEARRLIALEDIKLKLKTEFRVVTDEKSNIIYIKIPDSLRRLKIVDIDGGSIRYDDCFEDLNEFENPEITNLIATKMENIEIQENE